MDKCTVTVNVYNQTAYKIVTVNNLTLLFLTLGMKLWDIICIHTINRTRLTDLSLF